MISMFNRVKVAFIRKAEEEGGDEAGENAAKRQRATPLETAIKHLINLRPRIEKIDIDSLNRSEKAGFLKTARELRDYLDEILKA